ncbi:MAG: shikimate kinase [Actinobacteria bacterium HGW-Actinobacteria-4]|nr:MAG: shikimate kinase [Actinobacteria bacterium HGW-Actinobacteria-4]
MPSPRIVLIGPPGSGKSSVGKELARLWGVERRDTDEDVEVAAGKSISEIFIDDGEPVFRALETQAVVAAVAEFDGVLSLGGGAVLAERTQSALEAYVADGGEVVFLDVSLTAAAPRVGLNTSRPLLMGNPRQQWRELMEARRPIYERLATTVIDTDHHNPRRVARLIAGLEEST